MTTPALADLQLIVVGDGELRAALEAETKELGIATRVHFLGARRDLGDLLAAMDVFVMPSLWEGLPLSMILAMGAAMPVVATEVAGIPEIVVDGETGWLVPAGNSLALATGARRRVRRPRACGASGEGGARLRAAALRRRRLRQLCCRPLRSPADRARRMKLGIVYHMPFWRAADGTLRELEGSFARYVDSLAPYFDEISLCVPTLDAPSGAGHGDSRRRTSRSRRCRRLKARRSSIRSCRPFFRS